MSIDEAFWLYARDVIHQKNQSRKTEEHHNYALKSLISFLGGDKPIAELTPTHIRLWRNQLELRRCTTETIYGYLVRLRVVLDYANKEYNANCLSKDKILLPKRKRRKAPTYLTEEEISQLIIVASHTRGKMRALRNAALIALLYSSGIRVGELVSLNRMDMYYDTFVVNGKGDEDRPCFIDPRARYYIDRYLDARTDFSDALFVSDIKKRRITEGTAQEILRNVKRKAGIKRKATPHTVRHSFATNFLRNNGNMRHLQKMLGHESLETTQIYAHAVDEDLRRAHQNHHTIETPVQINKTAARQWEPVMA